MRGIVKGGLNDSGGGGILNLNDWSAYNTLYNWAPLTIEVAASSWGTALDIVGEGFLVFARADAVVSAARNPDMRITVDGAPYLFEGINIGNDLQGNLLTDPIYYKTSIKVEIYNRSASTTTLRLDYTCLQKSGIPGSNQTILSSANRKMAELYNPTTTYADVVNISGSGYLLSVETSGYFDTVSGASAGSLVQVAVFVDSSAVMNNRPTWHTTSANYKNGIFKGPIRFSNSLIVRTRAATTGSLTISRVWYTLD